VKTITATSTNHKDLQELFWLYGVQADTYKRTSQQMRNCRSLPSILMTERRFYFQIKAANVLECVTASSLTEAKLIAADTWLEWWSQIEWLNSEQEPING